MRKFALLFCLFSAFVVSAAAQKTAAEKAFAVRAGGYTWFDYTFDRKTEFKGRFRASGGKNDIECYIMDSDGFENWRNGNQAQTYFSSGRVTVANFNVVLPAGTYHLVFSNRWSVITPKAVTLWLFR